jgi:hypothetical protein
MPPARYDSPHASRWLVGSVDDECTDGIVVRTRDPNNTKGVCNVTN